MKLHKIIKHIILADDDEDDREIFRLALQELKIGADVVYAENGEQLLSTLKTATPCVVFLDLNMPLINGFECLRNIRLNAHTTALPVVILSTSNNITDINKCYELGATYYVVKPFSYMQLSVILQDLLSRNMEPGKMVAREDFLVHSQAHKKN